MIRDEACYLYAVTSAEPGVDLGTFTGVAGAQGESTAVQSLTVDAQVPNDGSIRAVFSVIPTEKIRPDRRNLAAHQGVLRALLEAGISVLPASFGLIAPSRRSLIDLLRTNREAIAGELRRLGGRIEMTLKVVWDVKNIFEYFVFACPELAALRDGLARMPAGAAREEKIEIGRTFEAMRDEARRRSTAEVMRVIGGSVVEIRERPVRDEKGVMDLACLVERNAVKAYEQTVFEAASLFDDNYAFDYGGPWPPFSFVDVSLDESMSVARSHAGANR